MRTRPTTLLGTGRRYWPLFLGVWLFPVALLGVITAGNAAGLPDLPYVMFPVFFITVGVAMLPAYAGWADRAHVTFWAMIVPFLIWAVAVYLRLAVLAAARRPDLI
jgi:hypothetical protein